MSNDPFSLDMFGNTALSSGLGFGLGTTEEFAPGPAAHENTATAPEAHVVPLPVVAAKPPLPGKMGDRFNFYLDDDDRDLPKSWKERARINVAAILSANEIEKLDVPVTREHQKRLIRFTGFGASELASGMFRRPGEVEFRDGWDDLGGSLESVVSETDYASLARCTQYAHFTPEFIIRAMWAGLQRLGWRGGRVLEPGIGTGLFPALMPQAFRASSYVTGIELDPVTARIVRLLQPKARIVNGDFARTDLGVIYDLAIGNPPFSDRTDRKSVV